VTFSSKAGDSMAIQVECGSCSKEYRIKDEKAGASFKCRDCGARIDVPELDSGDEWDEYGDDTYEEDDYEPAPRRQPRRKPQKKSAGANPVIFMIIGGAAVLIIGVVVLVMNMGGDEPAGVDDGSAVAQADENRTGETAAVTSGSTDTPASSTDAVASSTTGRSQQRYQSA
jgi:transcription initiation factor TFIIIB Brf1 subunit/transcription initiation factor TFIIB